MLRVLNGVGSILSLLATPASSGHLVNVFSFGLQLADLTRAALVGEGIMQTALPDPLTITPDINWNLQLSPLPSPFNIVATSITVGIEYLPLDPPALPVAP